MIGKVLSIGPTQQIPTKNGSSFFKRELVLDATRYDSLTGEKRVNFPSFVFSNKNCDLLDKFKKDDIVEVSFVIQGREYAKDGVTKYINDVVGFNIVPFQRAEKVAAPAPAEPSRPETIFPPY